MAREISAALTARGLSVWYDQTSIVLGDSIAESIGRGLRMSRVGLLLVTPTFLKRKKGWVTVEFRSLLGASAYGRKRLLQIWRSVTKSQVERRHSALADINALHWGAGLITIADEIFDIVAAVAPPTLIVPTFESPVFRFLHGTGSLRFAKTGETLTLWRCLLELPDTAYPLNVEDSAFARRELASRAANILAENENAARYWVGDEGVQQLGRILGEMGLGARAGLAARTGRLEEAVPIMERGVAAARRSKDRWDLVHSLNEIGLGYRRTGRLDKAFKAYQEAARLNQGEDAVVLSDSYCGLGLVSEQRGQLVDARKWYSRAEGEFKRARSRGADGQAKIHSTGSSLAFCHMLPGADYPAHS